MRAIRSFRSSKVVGKLMMERAEINESHLNIYIYMKIVTVIHND